MSDTLAQVSNTQAVSNAVEDAVISSRQWLPSKVRAILYSVTGVLVSAGALFVASGDLPHNIDQTVLIIIAALTGLHTGTAISNVSTK